MLRPSMRVHALAQLRLLSLIHIGHLLRQNVRQSGEWSMLPQRHEMALTARLDDERRGRAAARRQLLLIGLVSALCGVALGVGAFVLGWLPL